MYKVCIKIAFLPVGKYTSPLQNNFNLLALYLLKICVKNFFTFCDEPRFFQIVKTVIMLQVYIIHGSFMYKYIVYFSYIVVCIYVCIIYIHSVFLLSLQRSMLRLFSCKEKFVQQYKSINMTEFDLKLVAGCFKDANFL